MREEPQYIATFPAGCFEIIESQLKKLSIGSLKILSNDESSVSFTSKLAIEKLIEFRFFTNIFLVLDVSNLYLSKRFIKMPGYRLMAIDQGKPTKVDPSKKKRLSRTIEDSLGLKLNLKKSVDIVLLKRSGSSETATLRLPRNKFKREPVPAGALRPELAHILLLLSGVRAKDTLLDPFAGHGSIAREAARGFGLKDVITVEKDEYLASTLRDLDIEVVQGDASTLNGISNESVDRIVTDPPWGVYESPEDLADLYQQALNSFIRVLRPMGIAVVLSGSNLLNKAIKDSKKFKKIKEVKVLVSGKKAKIFKLQKIS